MLIKNLYSPFVMLENRILIIKTFHNLILLIMIYIYIYIIIERVNHENNLYNL